MTPLPRLSGTHLQAMIRSGGLRNGDRVVATVLRHLGGSDYVIAVRGNAYPTRSTVSLAPGAVFTARVEQTASTVLLRLEGARGFPQFLSSSGLGSAADRVIAQQLLVLGLPVAPDVVISLRRWHDDRSARSPLRLRIVSLLRDKGISPTEALVADLETVVLGMHTDKRGSDDSHHRRRRRTYSAKPPLALNSGTPDHGVQIFNHLTGSNGRWVILPVGTAEGLGGSLQLFYAGKKPAYDRAVLTVRSDPYYWGFSWANPSGSHRTSLAIHTDFDGEIPGAELQWVEDVLKGFGIQVDQRISPDPLLASFAIFQLQAIMKGVDEVV